MSRNACSAPWYAWGKKGSENTRSSVSVTTTATAWALLVTSARAARFGL